MEMKRNRETPDPVFPRGRKEKQHRGNSLQNKSCSQTKVPSTESGNENNKTRICRNCEKILLKRITTQTTSTSTTLHLHHFLSVSLHLGFYFSVIFYSCKLEKQKSKIRPDYSFTGTIHQRASRCSDLSPCMALMTDAVAAKAPPDLATG